MTKLMTIAVPLALATLVSAGAGAAAPVPTYRVAATIPGPDAGGWDYARTDPAAHRLYVARSASVTVVDTARGVAIGSIGSIAHGHAVVPIAGHRLLVTSGDDASVRIIAADDGRELGRVAVGDKPDAAIASDDGRIAFVMNARSGTVSILDLTTLRVVRTVTVRPGLEYAALTPDGTLFVNDEDAGELEVIDVAHGRAAGPIALPGCDAPTGLAFDARTDRLIAACANGKAAIVGAKRRSLIALVDIGAGPDAVILDAKRRLAFVPCGKDGVLDILSLDGAQVTRVGRVKTATGARTGALDADTGAIYLPTAAFDPPAAPGGRPVARRGTFKIVVVRPA